MQRPFDRTCPWARFRQEVQLVQQGEGTPSKARHEPAIAERRRHRRFIDEINVRFRDLEGTSPSIWGRSRNLSLGGLCLVTDGPVAVDSHLALELHIKDETAPIVVLGRVLRCTSEDGCHAAGLEFVWVSAEDCATLKRLADYFRETYGETGDLRPTDGE